MPLPPARMFLFIWETYERVWLKPAAARHMLTFFCRSAIRGYCPRAGSSTFHVRLFSSGTKGYPGTRRPLMNEGIRGHADLS